MLKYPKVCDYVPEPQPVSSDRIIACHYYPGWKKGQSGIHNGFADLQDYPERTPLLGYYDEANPEVTDWEIKWAVEHGINCFIYCWYRYKTNLGKPVTREALRLGHALHEGLFHARYRKYMKFAIMYECSSAWGVATGPEDFLNNVLPFWIENYFRREEYLKLADGTPIVYVYSPNALVEALGGPERCAETLEKARAILKKEGFAGLHFSACHSIHPIESFAAMPKAGFDSSFQYCWFMYPVMIGMENFDTCVMEQSRIIPSDLVIKTQLKRIQERIDYDPRYFMFTCSCMRDSHPWLNIPGIFSEESKKNLMFWKLTPSEWRSLLKKTKSLTDSLPAGSIGRQIFILDAWNEWSEGHYISPNTGDGFQYLQAAREVFTDCSNLPDYRVPSQLGLGPYDYEWQNDIP